MRAATLKTIRFVEVTGTNLGLSIARAIGMLYITAVCGVTESFCYNSSRGR